MKNKKKIRYKRRVLIYTSLTVFILFSIVDFYFETEGLPDGVAISLQKKLKEKGLDIQFEDVKLGVIHGLVLTKPILQHQFRQQNLFEAETLKIGLSFSIFERFGFAIGSFEIHKGNITIPLFPEDGEEGENDELIIQDFDAIVEFDNKSVDIKHFKGQLSPFLFTASGTLKNILPYAWKATSGLKDKKHKLFSVISLIEKIPYQTRCRFYRELLKFQDGKFRTAKPECQLIFNIDVNNSLNSFIKADINSPAFKYGGFDIENIVVNMSVRNNIVDLNKLNINLPSGGNIKLRGKLDLIQNKVTGTADFNVFPFELTQILQREKLYFPKYIKLGEKPVKISATVHDFSLTSMNFAGFLTVDIPLAYLKGVPLTDINADFFINQNKITANAFSLNTKTNSLKGNFEFYPESKIFNIHARVNGPPHLLKEFTHGENNVLITETLKRFTFPKNANDIKIILDMHAVFSDDFFYMLSADVSMNDFSYNNVNFESASTHIILDSNSLVIIPAMTVKQKDTLTTISMVYDNSPEIEYHVESEYFTASKVQENKLIAELNGNISANNILTCLFADWRSDVLDLSEPAKIKAHGVINFKDMQQTLLKVKLTDVTCYWQELPIKHGNCDLIFKGMDMEIKNVTGKLYNGDITFNYTYNFSTWNGKIGVVVKDADFGPITKYIGGELTTNEKGKLSLIIDNTYYYEKNGNFFMNGKGKLWIRNADLWDIPIINEFGELTEKWIGKDWGNISKLDADLEFKTDHVYSSNIVTDGTAISLRAKGSYYWNTNDFDYIIHADVMKSALPFNIISKIFNPLTWLLETKVSRKNNKITWEKIHTAKRLFK